MISYIDELAQIREFLETQQAVPHTEPYPSNHCDRAARVASEILGLGVVHGEVRIENRAYPHTCNYDPKNKVYADITKDQFGFRYSKVCIEQASQSDFHPWAKEIGTKAKKAIDDMLKDKVDTLVLEYLSRRRSQ